MWARLREIPFGETVTYGEIARETGSAARAVGQANGRNAISIIVPCHRVVGANGSLTGYAGGIPTKQQLLSAKACSPGGYPSRRRRVQRGVASRRRRSEGNLPAPQRAPPATAEDSERRGSSLILLSSS